MKIYLQLFQFTFLFLATVISTKGQQQKGEIVSHHPDLAILTPQ